MSEQMRCSRCGSPNVRIEDASPGWSLVVCNACNGKNQIVTPATASAAITATAIGNASVDVIEDD